MFRAKVTSFLRNFSSTPVNKLRVAGMVLAFFVIVNLLLLAGVKWYYAYHNSRVKFGYRLPDKFVLIRKELPAVFHLIEKDRSKYDINVIMLGDSVSYGAGSQVKPNENIGRYLEDDLTRALPGKKVKVWNLAIPGSKPGDLYFVYRKALELKPDLIVANFNYIFYTPSNIKSPVVFKWLVGDFDQDGRYRAPVESLLCPNLEHRLEYLAGQYIPVYRYRDLVNALVFKDYPGKKFQAYANGTIVRLERLFAVAPAYPTVSSATTAGNGPKKNEWFYQDWSVKLPTIAYMYNNTPIDTATNPAYLFTRQIIKEAQASGTPAVFFLAGQNHRLLHGLIDNKEYVENNRKIDQLFAEQQASYINFDNRIPDWFFTDNVHLTAPGNQLVARNLTGLVLAELNRAKAVKP